MSEMQTEFLRKAYAAACAAEHLFPEYAACEAALESAWGQSKLALAANNLFGQKQSHPPLQGTGTLALPTREFVKKQWVTVNANWVRFASWADCFKARMQLLERLSEAYPYYRKALLAANGEEFTVEVSKTWSTDPERAAKVMAVHAGHKLAFAEELEEA